MTNLKQKDTTFKINSIERVESRIDTDKERNSEVQTDERKY